MTLRGRCGSVKAQSEQEEEDVHLGVNTLDRNELLRLAKDLGSKNGDGSRTCFRSFVSVFSRIRDGVQRTVSNLVILHLRDVNENLRSGVVERNGLEDRRSVVRDGDLARRGRVKDLVHALGTKGGLDEVTESEGTDEGGETGLFRGGRG
jgi:hypothetical protein